MTNDIIKAIAKIDAIEEKFKNKKKLSVEEIESLGIFYSITGNSALEDPVFEYIKFKELYLIYGENLDFNGKYYKRNPNKRISEALNFKELEKINQEEFNRIQHDEMKAFLIKEAYLIPINDNEIQEAKKFLEKIAYSWSEICLNLRHSNEELKVISKETRETLGMQNIQDFRDHKLNSEKRKDILKGLWKSYYIFHEVKKTLEIININNESLDFKLNGVKTEINFYSLIHIFNRHFGEILSSQNLITTKTFHNTKINPLKIHLFIDHLFKLVKSNNLEKEVDIKNDAVLINFHGVDYGLFFKEYKNDKSKFILETFFIIEKENQNADRLVKKISTAKSVKLDWNLILYLQK